MSGIEFIDKHEAKIRSITMEAPEGYEFGHIVKAEVELRVGKLEFTTDKEGNVIRTAVLTIESAHIKEAIDPAEAFANAGSGAVSLTDDDDTSDDDDSDASPNTVTSPDGRAVDASTGEFLDTDTEDESDDRQLVDTDVGF